MIKETKDPKHLKFISLQAQTVKGMSYTAEEYMSFLTDKMSRSYMRIFIDIDDSGKINGFIVLSIVEPMPKKEEVFIDLAWTNPDSNGLARKFQAVAEIWARKSGITKVSMIATRGINAYKKKFGFRQEGIILSKEVKL